MNILIINTFDSIGGAARAAQRLLKGLNQIGVNAAMLVREKKKTDENVVQIKPMMDDNAENELAILDSINQKYIKDNRTDLSNTLFSLGYPGFHIAKTEIVKQADIINLHWVARFQSTESISSILDLEKPVIWTLHDQNPLTGGCHYSAGCNLFKDNCENCPQLSNDPFKLPYYNLQNKIHLLRNKKITLVTPSQWLADLSRQSRVFYSSAVLTIPNSLDTDIFSPQNKSETKRKLGLPGNLITLLLGTSGWRESRKGFSRLISSLEYCLANKKFKNLIKRGNMQLLCFGAPAAELKDLGIPFKSFGHVDSDQKLSDIYSASDIFLSPSLEDNLPNMIMESMACGTPPIAFNIGGIPDMVIDNVSGCLIPFCNTKKFSEGILDLVSNPKKRIAWGEKSREIVENNYKLAHQAQNYKELFSRLLLKDCVPGGGFNLQKSQYCNVDLSFNKNLAPLYWKYANANS